MEKVCTDSKLLEIKPKENHNYVAFFLTFACNLDCAYCINLHDQRFVNGRLARKAMSADDWINAANRLVLRDDLPLTLQGGEPTLHKGFYRLANEVREDVQMDLLTNLGFDADEFIKNVPTSRFSRIAPYAPIRVSYHPGQNKIEELIPKTLKLMDAGYKIGLFGILHPDESIAEHILEVQQKCAREGIDFRTKEFLGEWNGNLYGTFKYEGSVCGTDIKSCHCRTTELIVDPSGYVYKCHSDLYNARNPYAHILDEDFNEERIDEFRECNFYGNCNPCDVKIKTNRFQVYGHTSVEIRNIKHTENLIKSNATISTND
jgi:MoaA/NifB/PqqE/SkfB family radical SAM enzyme